MDDRNTQMQVELALEINKIQMCVMENENERNSLLFCLVNFKGHLYWHLSVPIIQL